MIHALVEFLGGIAIYLINTFGYFGVALAMGIESANIPLPSEIILPFSGFVVSTGELSFWGVVISSSIGGTIGSAVSYALGYYGGETYVRKLIRSHGKYLLIFEYELDHSMHWFKKHGQIITFTARMLPIVRTFISLPAGMSKMNFNKFITFAFIGTFIWSIPLTYLGVKLGENWDTLGTYFRKFDYLIVIVFILLGAYYVYHKIKSHKKWLKDHKSKTDSKSSN